MNSVLITNLKRTAMPIMALLFSVSTQAQVPAETDVLSEAERVQFEAEAKQKVSVFASTLKQALMHAVKTGGLTMAVDVCHQQAPAIAQSLSTDGWTVGRTSLKARNPDNRPDTWESAVLTMFENQRLQGEPAGDLVAKSADENSFRFMKAIPTGELCVSCHGSSIESNLKATIDSLYPQDQATGFKVGDIRGAFTVTKSLQTPSQLK
ncbi:Tll0287-like domain-containing protein [Alteromonas facilis]|uniref:Tll0287-like domain-containing protein n=1 Tax=Alteromonas facilis TaxID=2048004 RepID=UPI00196A7019|nr:DUF3365 domain-containing protein [Alteromonas facilis]